MEKGLWSMGIPCLVFFCLITWLGRGTGLIILIYFHHNFKQSLNVSLRYEMLYFMKPFSMVPIGRLGHLGCGTVPTSLKLAWHSDPACRGHRPSVRYFGLCCSGPQWASSLLFTDFDNSFMWIWSLLRQPWSLAPFTWTTSRPSWYVTDIQSPFEGRNPAGGTRRGSSRYLISFMTLK